VSRFHPLRFLLKFDAALVVACFVLAMSATVALATSNIFLNQSEPPSGGNNNGLERLNSHVWGWAQNGSGCIQEYIVTAKTWTSANCAFEASEGVNDYPGYAPLSKPGAWNNPNRFYGTHLTQGEQWY
jgi:hypothetical protein